MSINYRPQELEAFVNKIPKNILHGLEAYAEKTEYPGGFIESCIANDFARAVQRADHRSITVLKEISWWIDTYLPSHAHGSYQAMKDYWSIADFRQNGSFT